MNEQGLGQVFHDFLMVLARFESEVRYLRRPFDSSFGSILEIDFDLSPMETES